VNPLLLVLGVGAAALGLRARYNQIKVGDKVHVTGLIAPGVDGDATVTGVSDPTFLDVSVTPPTPSGAPNVVLPAVATRVARTAATNLTPRLW
jgi:hypothetical protein